MVALIPHTRHAICVSVQSHFSTFVRKRFISSIGQKQVVIITGSSAGIGKEAAYQLAKHNLHVILANRNKQKTEPIVHDIIKSTGNTNVEFMELDTASIRSVVNFVDQFKLKNLPLHTLINNAGVIGLTGLSEDGFELQFATNYLGHFVLTKSLLDVLEQSAPARIIHVSSDAYRSVKELDFKKLKEKDTSKLSFASYMYSKCCQVAFSNMLAKKLNAKQNSVYSVAVHPGFVSSEIWRKLGGFWQWLIGLMGSSTSKGAKPIVDLVLCPTEKLHNGEGFFNKFKWERSTSFAANEEFQNSLWKFSEDALAEYHNKKLNQK